MADFDPYYEWLGIPPKDQPPHHYRLLGIELYESHLTAIDAAANRIMAYLQELSNGENGALAQQLLNEVSAARVCLLNKKRKATYDQTLKTKLSNKKQKKKNKPATVKTPPPLPVAIPVEPAEESTFSETGIPQISTEDSHPGSSLGASSRRTTRRSKTGDKKILLIVIILLLLVATALGIMRFRPNPKATSKTEKATNLENVDKTGSLRLDDVIEEAQDLAFSLSQNEEVNYGKLIEIKEITALLIRPHWKQIAIVKPAERKECYQLAIEHAEELFSNNHTLQHHKQEYRKKQAGSSKQPPQFDDRLSREAGKNYRKQYGTEFDTKLAQLLGNSK